MPTLSRRKRRPTATSTEVVAFLSARSGAAPRIRRHSCAARSAGCSGVPRRSRDRPDAQGARGNTARCRAIRPESGSSPIRIALSNGSDTGSTRPGVRSKSKLRPRLVDDALAAVKVDLARLGPLDPARGAVAQPQPDRPIESADPAREGNVWHPQRRRRAPEAAGPHHLDKRRHLVQQAQAIAPPVDPSSPEVPGYPDRRRARRCPDLSGVPGLSRLPPVRVGRPDLRNRLVMAPITRSRARPDGTPGALAAADFRAARPRRPPMASGYTAPTPD